MFFYLKAISDDSDSSIQTRRAPIISSKVSKPVKSKKAIIVAQTPKRRCQEENSGKSTEATPISNAAKSKGSVKDFGSRQTSGKSTPILNEAKSPSKSPTQLNETSIRKCNLLLLCLI